MIKANELRIGNILQPFNESYEIVKEIKEENILCKISQRNLPFNIFSGIPLTEEWLLKFGFQKVKGESFYDNAFHSGALRINGTKVLLLIGSDYQFEIAMDYDDIELPMEIDFVHQLQNLYFALSGEELQIKAIAMTKEIEDKIQAIADDVYYNTIHTYVHDGVDTFDANEMKEAIKDAIIKGVELGKGMNVSP